MPPPLAARGRRDVRRSDGRRGAPSAARRVRTQDPSRAISAINRTYFSLGWRSLCAIVQSSTRFRISTAPSSCAGPPTSSSGGGRSGLRVVASGLERLAAWAPASTAELPLAGADAQPDRPCRLDCSREGRVAGRPRLQECMPRLLPPSVRTCGAAADDEASSIRRRERRGNFTERSRSRPGRRHSPPYFDSGAARLPP
jgi:hypothetical protein